MPSKFVIFLKSIGRKWFLFLIAFILILAIYHQIAAIVITLIAVGLFILSYVPSFLLKRKLLKFMDNYYRIEDNQIAKKLNRSLRDIQGKMFDLSLKQEYRNWLIVFLNNHYIFYHELTIERFKKLYNKGFNDKEILDNLKKTDIETRGEIKAIADTLIKNNRLKSVREISVKAHTEKKRFENI
ncbi:MAG: hypothetical protein ACFFAN_04805 [Promethearchaeota archaeon]